MKRDYLLWKFILQQVRDHTKPADMDRYEESSIVYNSSLLIKGGYIDGDTVENGDGIVVTALMRTLTNEGHDLLDKFEAEENKPNSESPMSPTPQYKLTLFISHSAKDVKLASALIDLLRSALNITANEIRCTSVDGFGLPIGADTAEQLRQEIHEAKAFIGLITSSSIASAYVMFELGARWGAKMHLAPLLGAGAGTDLLRGPLSLLNALHCEKPAQVHKLISDLAHYLKLTEISRPEVYESLIDELVQVSKLLGNSGEPSERKGSANESFLKAIAKMTSPQSCSVEAVNHGSLKIVINAIEATFEGGVKEISLPRLTQNAGGNNMKTFVELKERGDVYLVTIEEIRHLFNGKTPIDFDLLDTLGNRYPVQNAKESLQEISDQRKGAVQSILSRVFPDVSKSATTFLL